MVKIVTVIGARPQIIKAAVVSREINKYKRLKEIIVHTGQHFDRNMSEIFFRELKVPRPKYYLGVNQLAHGAMTAEMLKGIEKILVREKPNLVMVYGDTNSTLSGALAAAKLQIQIAHVEAGLRSFDWKMPEEVNRVLTDRISAILFCPTVNAVRNLRREGFNNHNCRIVKCGDVMKDAAMVYSRIAEKSSRIVRKLNLNRYILGTVHRQENTDSEAYLRSIFSAFNKINTEINVVVPLHPRTKNIVTKRKIKTNFTVIEPVGYLDMIELLKHSSMVMTDSGGLQKESFFFKKHCLTLRDTTEWTELVEYGFNMLAGTDKDKIFKGYKRLINKKSNFAIDLYGDGNASKEIAKEIFR